MGTHYYPAADVGELLRNPDWRNSPARAGDDPDAHDLLLPIARPGKVICVGLNYRDHAAEVGKPTPEVPTLFSKVATTLTGPHADIIIPGVTDEVDWEAELGIVIGSTVGRGRQASAHEAILGYTVVNDVSVRDWQRRTSQWFQGKNFDHSTPVGPWVVTSDELDPTHGLRVETVVNDHVEQSGTTADLIFSPSEVVAYVSQFLTLQPGDIIATGTPSGVGFAQEPPRFLRSGDVLRTRIEGVGELQNSVYIDSSETLLAETARIRRTSP
jgi:acylpyruvate hydrolase